MDRDNELEEEYKTINYKEFVRQEIESRRVPGEWYLFERQDGKERSQVDFSIDGDKLYGGFSVSRMIDMGWIATPIDIFKKE